MNRAGIIDRISRGYGRASAVVGNPVDVFRPYGASDPIVLPNRVFTGRMAAIATGTVGTSAAPFLTAPKFGDADLAAMMDARGLQSGDYIQDDAAIYFLHSVETFGTPRAVWCNCRVTVKRPDGGTAGSGYYGGDVRANETALVTSWPASVRQLGAGRQHEAGLPGDVPATGYQVLLPSSVPVQIRASDVIEDDQTLPMRFIVAGAEQSALGWRIQARLAVT